MFTPLLRTSLIATAGIAAAATAYQFSCQPDLRSPFASSFFTPMSSVTAATPPAAFSPEEFRSFPLVMKQRLTHDTNVYRFELPSPEHVMGLPVASCVVTKAPGADGKPVIRPYTPVSSDAEVSGHFDLIIKVYPEGKMGQHIDTMRLGEELELKGPFIKLAYQANAFKQVVMLAGGSGITPMYQVLKEIARNPADRTQVLLFFANRTGMGYTHVFRGFLWVL
jgi:cytochrome-b5 reductase